ncbi:[Pyruvate dehydrogenase (acetyl-transferring)] kinase isozyme 3, mitochondrial [Cymbomonas tetramitiformis]|uniref:Protein-serine/threonine kinase n=1 Tax=Cymbomonas tetramitiformis TaxID=36881 RepID=A0AAE0L924_9CHLO|nr:[Pyruvate dehydrogenase (acetyl-transferring)] kinase isozyme 3, mitochondrial [Cymbomonas tetramitiformis]
MNVQTAQKTMYSSQPSKHRPLSESVSRETLDDIYRCSLKRQTGVSLKYMLDFGSFPIERQVIFSAQFLHKELPIRLAHRVAELENLPHGLSAKSQVMQVRDWYVESFKELRQFRKIVDRSDESDFVRILKRIYERHSNVVPMMAMGVAELKRDFGEFPPEVHQFLDGFYMSRIGIRALIGQHVALHSQQDGYIGMICIKVRPMDVAWGAVDDARSICMREKGSSPEVQVFGDPNFAFSYVPSHLHQMLFELVKNSLRAVHDKYEDSDIDPPPIRIVIADGGEDVSIKVSDEGGGIPRSGLPRIWTYMYTTADTPLLDNADTSGVLETPPALAGYGYGLPLSRLYARYFGGDLQILSMEGYGTDAYLHISRLGNVQEPLP